MNLLDQKYLRFKTSKIKKLKEKDVFRKIIVPFKRKQPSFLIYTQNELSILSSDNEEQI